MRQTGGRTGTDPPQAIQMRKKNSSSVLNGIKAVTPNTDVGD